MAEATLETVDSLQEALIDAAETCFAARGVAKTTMSNVAAAAGVSRTTLYKRFAVMEDVLQAVFMREFDRFEGRLQPRLEPLRDPAQRLVEIVVSTAENVPDNAGLARLRGGPRTRTEDMAWAAGRRALNARVQAMIEKPLDELAAQGRLREGIERAELVEWIRRVGNSLGVFPQPQARSYPQRREFVARFLLPSICSNVKQADSR